MVTDSRQPQTETETDRTQERVTIIKVLLQILEITKIPTSQPYLNPLKILFWNESRMPTVLLNAFLSNQGSYA